MQRTFEISSALDLWQKETSLPSIPTFSQSLDKVLGSNGIELGLITEILGLPGTGKTQLCLQLCASVQIPKCLGGLCSEAIFIDTNTNFTLERYQEILWASYSKWKILLESTQEETIDSLLKQFHYIDAFDLDRFCAVMHNMNTFLAENPNVKLIVIDSISFPFKDAISERQRTGLLFRQMADLQSLAMEKRIAIVLTNEMSTRLGLSGDQVVGGLGDAWSHRCNKRLLLSTPKQGSDERIGVLVKSNNSPQIVGKFQKKWFYVPYVAKEMINILLVMCLFGSGPIHRSPFLGTWFHDFESLPNFYIFTLMITREGIRDMK